MGGKFGARLLQRSELEVGWLHVMVAGVEPEFALGELQLCFGGENNLTGTKVTVTFEIIPSSR